MFRHVVVPLDGSPFAERALPVACALASAFGARLELVHATLDRPADEEQAYLDEIAARLSYDDAATRIVHGFAGPAIGEFAASGEAPLICMATHGRSGVAAVVLGSVAEQLVAGASTPLVLVGPHFDTANQPPLDAGLGQLVLCFDGSDASGSVAPEVGTLARTLGLDVHVVMVLHRDGTFVGNDDATVPKQRAEALTEALVADGVPATLELLDGVEPGRAIAEYAASLPAALIAAATHGSGGLVHLALGSVAIRIAHRAPCPVMVWRPVEAGSG